MSTHAITIGSDPEFMLFDTKLGRIVSAIPVLNNTKETPDDLGEGIFMYADNALVEARFNPVESVNDFIRAYRRVLVKMHDKLGNRYRLIGQSANVYDRSDLNHPNAWEVGCNPNFDAYTGEANPICEFTSYMRTGSFHIHLGCAELAGSPEDPKASLAKRNAVKLLDVFLGCASVVFDSDPTSKLRRSLYGRAGEYRPTSYGIEYRVLGGFSLRSPYYVELVGHIIEHAMEYVRRSMVEEFLQTTDTDHVITAINTGNRMMAEAILKSSNFTTKLMAQCCANYTPRPMLQDWGI